MNGKKLLCMAAAFVLLGTAAGCGEFPPQESTASPASTSAAAAETTAFKQTTDTDITTAAEITTVTESETTTAATTAEKTTTTAATTADGKKTVENGDYSLVTPKFKAEMDAYEAFYDKYIAFMAKYKSGTGDAMAMLNDYMQMMEKLTEWTAWVNDIDTQTLTPADCAYYSLVTLRVSNKLIKAAL